MKVADLVGHGTARPTAPHRPVCNSWRVCLPPGLPSQVTLGAGWASASVGLLHAHPGASRTLAPVSEGMGVRATNSSPCARSKPDAWSGWRAGSRAGHAGAPEHKEAETGVGS